MVMEALIAVDDKTEQIEIGGPHGQPFELIDRVIVDQGRIVRDALIGNLQGRQHALGQRVERRHLGAALNFAVHLTDADIARFMLELGQGIQTGCIVKQALERSNIRGLQMGAYHRA